MKQVNDTRKRMEKVLASDRIGSNTELLESVSGDIEKVLEKYFVLEHTALAVCTTQDEHATLIIRVPILEYTQHVK